MEQITLYAFPAPDEPALCAEFMREHRKVLEDFGITNVTTNNEHWMHDPKCFVIVAQHPEQGMVGGIRLQLDHEGIELPMEEAIRKMDPAITPVLREIRDEGNGEVCGLWNANRYANKGVPVLLSQAVTAISMAAGAKRMVCFVAHYTKRHPARNGFIVLESVGESGCFTYPIPSIRAIAMVNPDTITLPHAMEHQRHLIYSLRLRPEQVRIEKPFDTELEVTYRMRLRNESIDDSLYARIQGERTFHAAGAA